MAEILVRANQWWRWMLVPTVAFVAGFAVAFAAKAAEFYAAWLADRYFSYDSDTWAWQFITPAVQCFGFAWVFVEVGFRLAPSKKQKTAAVLAVLTAAEFGLVAAAEWVAAPTFNLGSTQAIVECIAACVGAKLAYDRAPRAPLSVMH